MTTTFDAIIIGTGQAGPFLAGRLTAAGMKVAIVERGRFGGTCVNTGCTPTKAMVASAHAARMARRAADFGVAISGPVAVDMKKVKARRDAITGKSSKGIESMLKGMTNCTVFEGQARLVSPHEVTVGAERLSAERIFVNTGTRPSVPPIPRLDQVKYFTSDSLLDIDFLPRHLIIVGGGYIGLEFGQMYRRFGSEITIIETGARLMHREDEDVSAAIKGILEQEGINVRLNAQCVALGMQGDDVVARVDCASESKDVRGSHVLLAVGRRPNTDDLGLEKASVEMDERGYIVVDDQLRASVPGIWALGDCNGKGAFTHTSYNDFEIVAANLLDNGPRRVSDRYTAYAVYIDPPLGRAGMTPRRKCGSRAGRRSWDSGP